MHGYFPNILTLSLGQMLVFSQLATGQIARGDIHRDDANLHASPEALLTEIVIGSNGEIDLVISNEGDAGTDFTTSIDVTEDPSVEDVEHLRVLILSSDPDGNGRHTMLEGALEAGVPEGNILEIQPEALAETDLYQWDVLVFSDRNDFLFYHHYWVNKRLIDEWVESGGVLILAAHMTTHNPLPFVLPGQVLYYYGAATHADRNFLEGGIQSSNPLAYGRVNEVGDDSPDQIVGHSASDGALYRSELVNNERITNLSIIYHQEFIAQADIDRWVTLATWDFGAGHVCASTMNVTGFWCEGWMDNGPRWLARNFFLWADWAARRSWVSIEPASGRISSGEEVSLQADFSSELLLSGNYQANLNFYTDDLENADLIVPIELRVAEAPDAALYWSRDWGFPDQLDFDQLHQDMWSGTTYVTPIIIRNEGIVDLELEDLTFNGDGAEMFTISEEQLPIVHRREQTTLHLQFQPDRPIECAPTLSIHTNDPDEEIIELSLHATATVAPSIEIEPERFDIQIEGGEAESAQLTISNVGGGVLRFGIEVEILSEPEGDQGLSEHLGGDESEGPRRDNPGDVIDEFDLPDGHGPEGGAVGAVSNNLAWDEDRNVMWVANNLAGTFIEIDPSNNFRLIDWFGIVTVPREGPYDLAYHDNIIWAQSLTRNNYLMRFDVEGNRLDDMIPGDLDRDRVIIQGVAIIPDTEVLLVLGSSTNVLRLYAFLLNGERLGMSDPLSTELFNNWRVGSIEWADDHPEGQLWVHSNDWIFQFAVDEETWNITRRILAIPTGESSTAVDGIAYDGENIWLTFTNSQTCRIIDDGVRELHWLRVEPKRGEAGGGESFAATLTLDSRQQPPGRYEAQLHITSNDPDCPQVDVPVTLTVEAGPFLTVEWPAEVQFDPNEPLVDWNIFNQGHVFAGIPYEIPATFTNDGYESLSVQEISCGTASFLPEVQAFDLEPDESRIVQIRFQCDEPGEYADSLTILSNDPHRDRIVIPLQATAEESPHIVVDPSEIHAEMRSYEVEEHTINIANDGNQLLNWEARVELVNRDAGDDDANERRSIRSLEGDKSNSPHRDHPEGRFLLYQDTQWLGWVQQNVFQPIRDLDYEWLNHPDSLAEVNLDDYDAVWFELGAQSDLFRDWWVNHLAEIEEYIANGHSMYIEQGGMDEAPLQLPGELDARVDLQDGQLVVSGEDNWLVQQMNWREGQFFSGNIAYPFTGVSYRQEELDNLENSDGYQIIAIGTRTQIPTIVQYQYGYGSVIAAGVYTGRQWQMYNQAGQWGSCGEELLEYLLLLSEGVPWVTVDPRFGELQSASDQDVIVTLNTNDLQPGPHEATIHFESNDPHTPDSQVEVSVNVTGVPVPVLRWSEAYGYPDLLDWNQAYDDVFIGRYSVTVTLINDGTDTLHVAEISSDDAAFYADWDQQTQGAVASKAAMEYTLVLQTPGPGEYRGTVTFSFSDEGVEPVSLIAVATSTDGPILFIDPEEIESNLSTGQTEQIAVSIENHGAGVLEWRIEGERDEGRDRDAERAIRNLRTDEPNRGPSRDNAGDVLASFRLPRGIDGIYRSGFAWDSDNRWMWVAQYGQGGQPSLILAVDPFNNYELAAEFAGPVNTGDMCWYNGTIYALGQGQLLARFDQGGNNLGAIQFQGNFGALGIDVSPELGLFFLVEGSPDWRNRPIRVYRIADNGGLGEQIGTIQGCHDLIVNEDNQNHLYRSNAWVDAHRDGQLWLQTGGRGGLFAWQFRVNTETWEPQLVQHFRTVNAVGNDIDGFGHDGRDLWSSNWQRANVNIVDDGINEFGWLSWRPESGAVNTGEASQITVSLNASGMETGLYSGRLKFFSNDPFDLVNPDATLEIALLVSGHGNIQVLPGGPDVEPLDFEAAYFGFPTARSVMIRNVGVEDLIVQEVRRDQANPDFSVNNEDLADFTVAPHESRELQVWYDPNPERGGLQQAQLLIMTNDPNWENGYPLNCIASRGAMEAPHLELQPEEIEVHLGEDDSEEFVIEAENTGGSELVFKTEAVILDRQDRNHRQVHQTTGGPVKMSSNLRSVRTLKDGLREPLRDQPNGRGLLIQNVCGWYQWDFEQYFRQIEGLDYDRYRTWDEYDNANVNLESYDFIWFGNYESDQWITSYNAHLAEIECFVDGGGAIYYSAGSENSNVRPVFPGGLVYSGSRMQAQTNTPLMLNPEDNFFVNYLNENDPVHWEWRADQRLIGFREVAAVALGYFLTEDIEKIDNSDWHEVMVMGNEREEPVALTYRYGYGYCFVTTITDGYHHRWAETAQWGRTGEAVIWYLDYLSSRTPPFRLDPHQGNLQAGESLELFLTVCSAELDGGEYLCEIRFRSNDPERPDQVINIDLTVAGEPLIACDPIPEPFEGAGEVSLKNRGWVGTNSSIPVTIRNRGSVELNLSEIEIADAENWSFSIAEADRSIPARTSVSAAILFHPSEAGDFRSTIRLETNAANIPDGAVWWNVSAQAALPPHIQLNLPDQRDSLFVLLPTDGDLAERIIEIGNRQGESRDTLEFWIHFSDPEQPRLQQVRIEGSSGPLRDSKGDLIDEFEVPIMVTTGMTSDGNLIWGCDAQLRRVVGISKNTHEYVRHFAVELAPIGIAFDGENLWIGGGSRTVSIYNLNGDRIDQFDVASDGIVGMASDQREYVFIKTDWDNRIHVHRIDNYEEVAVINQMPGFLNNRSVGSIAWVPDHLGGELWGLDNDTLYQASVDERWQTRPVKTIPIDWCYLYAGPAHDGRDFWIGALRDNWRIIDDGIIEGLPDWLSLQPCKGNLAAGDWMSLTVGIDPTTMEAGEPYRKLLIIESNDPIRPAVQVVVHALKGLSTPRHFRRDDPLSQELDGWIESDIQHLLQIEDITIENRRAITGWEVGVFTPEGRLAGGALWIDNSGVELLAFGNNPDWEQTTGFEVGQPFAFRIWDDLADQEFSATAEFLEGSDVFNEGGESRLQLFSDAERTLLLHLSAGWNMASINIDPKDMYAEGENRGPDPERLFRSLAGENRQHAIMLLKDGSGHFWAPAQVFSNIPFWDLKGGYQVRMRESYQMEIVGQAIAPYSEIPLNAGWNLVAYLPTQPLLASAPSFRALSHIIDDVVIAKDGDGRFMNPERGFSNMSPWCEGRGYQIKVRQDVVLTYPAPDEAVLSLTEKAGDEQSGHHWSEPAPTGANMSLLITDFLNRDVLCGDQIAAQNNDGRIVGVGTVVDGMCGLAVWGDDPTTDVVDGLRDDEAFKLKLWNSAEGIESGLAALVTVGLGLTYQQDGLVVVSVSIENTIPDAFYLEQNFPNPFNALTRVAFGLPEASRVTIRVFDVAGREVATLVSDNLQAGTHSAVWNSEGSSSGVYLVKIETPSFCDARKVMLVR